MHADRPSFSGNKIKQVVFILTPENLCVLRVLCGERFLFFAFAV
jgi:hypothetical protein